MASQYHLPKLNRSSHHSHRSETNLQKFGALSINSNSIDNDRYNPTISKRHTYSTLNFDPKKSSMLPLSELERIKQNSVIVDYSAKKERKQGLHSWENRIKKDYDKKKQEQLLKFIKREEELRVIDQQEEVFRENQKKNIIHKANKQIFEENENVRQLKRQLLYSDMLKEQESLNEVKQHLNEQKKEMEEYYKEQDEMRRDQEQERVIQEEEHRKRKRELTKQMVEEQRAEAKQKMVEKYQADLLEGQIIQDQAREQIQKEDDKQALIRQKHKSLILEMKDALDEQQRLKKKEALRDKLEDEKIARQKSDKEKVTLLKEERQKFMAKQVREQRQKLIDAGCKRLQEFKKNEDTRISNQIKEADEKKERAEQAKQKKIAQLKSEIDDSIKISIQKKKEEQIKIKEDDNQYIKKIISNFDEQSKAEDLEKNFHRQKQSELKLYQLKQIEDKNDKKRELFREDLKEAKNIKCSLEMDKRVFNSWAEEMVDQWGSDGKNIKPIVKNLKRIQENMA